MGAVAKGPALILYRERQRQALLLAAQGVPYEEIANRLGWRSPQAAHAAVKSAVQLRMKEPADEFRAKKLAEIEDLKDKWRPKAGPMSVVDEHGNERLEDKGLRAMVLLLERECALQGVPLTGRSTEVNVFANAQAQAQVTEVRIRVPDDPEKQRQLAEHLRAIESLYDSAAPENEGGGAPAPDSTGPETARVAR